MNKNPPPSEKKPFDRPIVYYSGLAFQMLATILLGFLLGFGLQKLFPQSTFPFTTIFALVFTIFSLIQIIMELVRRSE